MAREYDLCDIFSDDDARFLFIIGVFADKIRVFWYHPSNPDNIIGVTLYDRSYLDSVNLTLIPKFKLGSTDNRKDIIHAETLIENLETELDIKFSKIMRYFRKLDINSPDIFKQG